MNVLDLTQNVCSWAGIAFYIMRLIHTSEAVQVVINSKGKPPGCASEHADLHCGTTRTFLQHCAKSLWGEVPCGSAVHGKVAEMSPAPSPNPLRLPNPLPPDPPPEYKEDKEELVTLPARDFALQLP